MADESPSHEELHEHVNPHLDPKEVPKTEYRPLLQIKPAEPLKSRFRLDWIYTKIRIGKFYPFPLVSILLLAVTMIPVILLALGINFPIKILEISFLKPIFEYMGIYSHKDMFVIMTWAFWWPIFILAIFFFKRIWCGGFCPFGLMTDIGNFFGKILRKGKAPKPINITKYIFIGFLVFKALGYLHDAINITNSAVLTIEFVIFFMVFAFTIGMIAPRRTFCRLFCFLGSLPHLFGRLSLYTLETDRSKCEKCEGQWCLTGHAAKPEGIATAREPLINLDGCPMFINIPQLSHKESNRNCILCGNCIKNCPYDAIHYKPKVPGYELYKGIDLNHHETIFVIGLIPLLAMFIAMEGGLLGDFARALNFPMNAHWAITGSFFLFGIVIFAFLYYVLAGIGALILNVDWKLTARNFGYIFLPFGYMAMLRDILITYLFKGSFLSVKFPNIAVAYPFFDIPLLLIGVAWSIYMAYKITQVTMEQGNQVPNEAKIKTNTLLQTAAILAAGYFWINQVFPEYRTTLLNAKIPYIMPFLLSAVLIFGFILLAGNYARLKSVNPFIQLMKWWGKVKEEKAKK